MAEPVDAVPVPYAGTVQVDSRGCFTIRLSDAGGGTTDRWAVWPVGTEEVRRGGDLISGVRFNGDLYLPGDRVKGWARLVPLDAIRGGEPGGDSWRDSGTSCGALVDGVIIVGELRRA